MTFVQSSQEPAPPAVAADAPSAVTTTGFTGGRISVRPFGPTTPGLGPGSHRMRLTSSRDAWIHVPANYRPEQPAPLVVVLHGAGGDAERGIVLLRAQADHAGTIVLAVASRASTWDMIVGGYGPDVAMIDRALAHTFARHAIDPSRLAIAGFSDGASYALSLGLGNGDLFTDVLAFSPGYMAPARRVGRPRVIISHGVHDDVLPIAACSRRLVPALREAGHQVTYHEFAGGHTVPGELRRTAVAWFRREPG